MNSTPIPFNSDSGIVTTAEVMNQVLLGSFIAGGYRVEQSNPVTLQWAEGIYSVEFRFVLVRL
jgi:hypothetical protein